MAILILWICFHFSITLLDDIAGYQGALRLGLLLIIPKKELGVIIDQRGDIIDRLRGLTLDLKTIYDQDFPRRLWERLADVFEFDDLADGMIRQETLAALGQIAVRDDLANGPRTVVNVLRRLTQRYFDARGEITPYSPIDLIEDFLSGNIVFDGTKRIQEAVLRALDHPFVHGDWKREQAVRLMAAFPNNGVIPAIQELYALQDAFEEVLQNCLGDLVRNVGDRNYPSTILVDLEVVHQESDWLTETVREFGRNYRAESAKTLLRAKEAFEALLVTQIFKKDWRKIASYAPGLIQNKGLLLEGAFPSFAREFPDRLVFLCSLGDDEPLGAPPEDGTDVAFEFRLRRAGEDGNDVSQLALERWSAHFSLNLQRPISHRPSDYLEKALGKALPLNRLTPLLLLTLYAYLDELRQQARIPKSDDQLIQYNLQPALLEVVVNELFDANLGAPFNAAGSKLLEKIIAHLLNERYGNSYSSLMALGAWRENLRKYKSALGQLPLSGYKQGLIAFEATKERVAGLLTVGLASLDNYIANMPDFIQVERAFPSRNQIKTGQDKGAILFSLHPFEQRILEWLQDAPSIRRNARTLRALELERVIAEAATMGYKAVEVEHIVELLAARELITYDKTYLLEHPRQEIPIEELEQLLSQHAAQMEHLNAAYPEEIEFKDYRSRLQLYPKHLANLRSRPDDASKQKLAYSLKMDKEFIANVISHRFVKMLEDTIALAARVPTSLDVTLLDVEVENGQYAAALHQQHSILLDSLRMFNTQVENVHNQLTEMQEALVSPASSELPRLSTTLNLCTSTIQDLAAQRQTYNEAVDAYIACLQCARELAEMRTRLSTTQSSSLSQLVALEQELDKLLLDGNWKQVRRLQIELQRLHGSLKNAEEKAREEFERWRTTYQQGLQLAGGTKQLTQMYSAADQYGSLRQLREEVRQYMTLLLDQLEDDRERLLSECYVLKTHHSDKFDTQLITRLDHENERITQAYHQHNMPATLESLETFVGWTQSVETARQHLNEVREYMQGLQALLQRPQLTEVEDTLWTYLKNYATEKPLNLVDIRDEIQRADDSAFWQAIAGLWTKGYLQVLVKLYE